VVETRAQKTAKLLNASVEYRATLASRPEWTPPPPLELARRRIVRGAGRDDGPCVYFLGAVGLVKIGRSKDVCTRLATLQCGSAVELSVLAVFYVLQKYLVGGLTAGAVKG